jgi:hypothetical protein
LPDFGISLGLFGTPAGAMNVSETYGQQEGTAYNGYFGCACYHPLFLFDQFGDLERVLLRRGKPVRAWTLTTLREKLVKIGAKVVRHARSVILQLAEVAVPRALFAALLRRIGRLRLASASG